MHSVKIHILISVLLMAQSLVASLDVGVRAQSFGGAYRAVASSNDIIFYNPAGLLKRRHIGADLDYKVATNQRLHGLGVSIVDSSTTAWGLGLGYNAGLNAQTDMPNTHLVQLAMSIPVVTDLFVLGTAFSYLNDPSVENQPYKHFFNMDVAIMSQLPAGLSFAVVADHLLARKGMEKTFGLSFAGAFDLGVVIDHVPLTVSFDWSMQDVASLEKLDHSLACGLQYIAYSSLPIRFGFKSELDDNHLLSMGTGFLSEHFALDGLYQQHLTVGAIRQFGVAIRMMF